MSQSNLNINQHQDEAQLDDRVVETIGRALRAHYDDLVDAPLPDRFFELLAELERRERDTAGRPGGSDAAK